MREIAYPYRVTVPPAGDPLFITLVDAREYLRVTVTDISDANLTSLIKAAQSEAERFTRLTLFTTRFETTRDFFLNEILLRRAPLLDIVSVQRLVDQVLETVSTDIYKKIDFDVLNYGSIVLKSGEIWPNDQDIEQRSILIEFDAGFGVDSSSLPFDLIESMKRILGDLFENRGDCCGNSMSSTLNNALGRFKIMTV